ncbi:putative amine oxidase [Acanthamoeba castellanii mimivirus]|uniref:Putative amine oxidase n=2 Tax=Mimivirus TaxID=315393 RepID=A0A0G2Y4S1_MIMIV|nr:putative amine oxidase [Acanthamoeba polyphaga mimivirus]ALR83699.1 putative amine oxidase [Niemeyer virus]BAV61276.1 putative amine oxidase [Acanthamoeba castellanii mimivirus]BAV62264.1 putative amine oxidase [Acanthamoeba castellanii mimivirus]
MRSSFSKCKVNTCNPSNCLEVDILIVGGGASGIYSAWRLSQTYPNKKVLVIEEKSYLGGRLESVYFGNEKIYAEVGGMRTFPSINLYVTAVIKKLKLQSIPVPYIEPDNIAYVKNTRLTVEATSIGPSSNPEKQKLIQLYKIPPDEQNISTNDIIYAAAVRAAPTFPEDWRTVYDYPELNNETFSEMFSEQGVSANTQQVFEVFSGYSFFISQRLAASTGIRENISISGENNQHFVVGGYSSIVFGMTDETFCNPNYQLFLNTSIKKITPSNSPNGLHTSILVDTLTGLPITIKSESIILSVPKDSLNRIVAPITPNTIETMNSLTDWRAFKAFLLVDQTTYQLISMNGHMKGRGISDLPARQVWAYSGNPPCVLIYCDNAYADFWKKYINDEINNCFPKFHDPCINKPLVSELKRQIGIIYSVDPSKIVVNKILYKYWYAGAYFSKPSDIPKLFEEVRTPLGPEYSVYLVGSDISVSQGWVDGALNTADNLLVKYYGVTSILDENRLY